MASPKVRTEPRRVVLELEPKQIEVVGEPLPADTEEPVSRRKQAENMVRGLRRADVREG